ncbi:hypothetical protein C7C46_00255 [Streptomyces tateyamensis]|uniref:Uncharacterized protein n=1 Tax=Streptomyces tateyamensis TaxID=565073 RepID=A0A2V4PPW4_9ACTN|nr:hypothetical protein [Streptomyces tateyamensis]PYC88476.1 hypothetical protein C7C46_00255 [Streptomyces tateyamensis]
MTDSQKISLYPPAAFVGRILPECACPADCGGRPEATRRLAPAYPTVRPGNAKPPAAPYRPTRRGELVFDVLNDRLGIFMDRMGTRIFLRPEGGGPEWEVDPRWVVKPA